MAQQVRWLSEEGVFASQERFSFIMLEKKRRAKIAQKVGESKTLHFQDDPLDGGASGAEAEAGSLTYGGEV